MKCTSESSLKIFVNRILQFQFEAAVEAKETVHNWFKILLAETGKDNSSNDSDSSDNINDSTDHNNNSKDNNDSKNSKDSSNNDSNNKLAIHDLKTVFCLLDHV